MTHHESTEKHSHTGSPCPVCSGASTDGGEHAAMGICKPCWYKILIVILIIMIAISYIAWFGIL